MTERLDLDPPLDLDCKLLRPFRKTAQWRVFEADHRGRPAFAWALLPELLVPSGSADQIGSVAGGAAYDSLAADVITGLHRTSRLKTAGWMRPQAVVRSPIDGVLWFRTSAAGRMMRPFERLPLANFPEFIGRLTFVLSSLHLMRVFHLDLHPDLIALDTVGQPSLLGLGTDLRRVFPKAEEDNSRLGRPGYSPPEMWDASASQPLGPWTDVYGAAALSYTVLLGDSPPDFRERVHRPEEARSRLIRAMMVRLEGGPLNAPVIACGIADGLSPRPADRPQNILAWGRRLSGSRADAPSPPQRRQVAGSGTKAGALGQGRVEPAPAPAPAKCGTAPPARRGYRYVAGALVGFFLLMLLIPILSAPEPSKPKPSGEQQADAGSDEVTINTARAEPTPPPSGILAGYAYVDDPVALGDRLARLWGQLPSGFDAQLALQRHRESGTDSCSQPLQLHNRRDGRGLLIDRPAGLVWVTRWSEAGQANPGELPVFIESVWGPDGRIDAPGLVGTTRRITWTDSGMKIGLDESGSSARTDQEDYVPCAD